MCGVRDEDLTMANQVKSVVKGMNCHIRRLGKIRHCVDKETSARVITVTSTCRLYYTILSSLASTGNTSDRSSRILQPASLQDPAGVIT